MSDRRRKLTEQKVSEMRESYARSQKTMPELAREHSLSLATVWNIIQGRSWKSSGLLTCPHCHKEFR